MASRRPGKVASHADTLEECRAGHRHLQHGSVRYEILEPVGSGGTGDVHAARVVGGLERRVCIKRLTGTTDPRQAAAIREEARLLARVRHANVVSLLSFGEDAVIGPFLVLELVEGLDLRALSRALAPERLADGVAVHVACALLRALAAVQSYLPGLVHRDVTPHNVLVSEHGEVKLGDFGIALARDRTLTASIPIKGKPGYMSPEQIRGEPLDPRSDLFAVGVVLYELLTGERPWMPRMGWGELLQTTGQPPVPIGVRRPRLHPLLAMAIDRLLSRSPDARYACAQDALRALAPFGAGELGSLRLAGLVAASMRVT